MQEKGVGRLIYLGEGHAALVHCLGLVVRFPSRTHLLSASRNTHLHHDGQASRSCNSGRSTELGGGGFLGLHFALFSQCISRFSRRTRIHETVLRDDHQVGARKAARARSLLSAMIMVWSTARASLNWLAHNIEGKVISAAIYYIILPGDGGRFGHGARGFPACSPA